MKKMRQCAAVLLLLSALTPHFSNVFAQGTAFTYQGRLNSSGSPANGLYDFRFRLDADPAGNTILNTVFTNAIGVTNGLFITTIDFGAGWFNGSNYWLEVDVRTNNASSYTALNPFQSLAPTPYAVFANTASNVSGTVSASQLGGAVLSANLAGTYGNAIMLNNADNQFSGAFSGNGGGLTNISVSRLTGDIDGNVFVGPSGNSTENGFENTANGFQALFSNTFGSFNTANGYQSLYFNTIGTFNTANGYSALLSNTNGIDNTADGNLALLVNTSGSFNTASGAGALKNLGSSGAGGTNNIALGSYAGSAFAGIESSNIDIGNIGVISENNTIRIGTPGIHTQTYLAGVINGNGGGLTNIGASRLTGDSAGNVFVGPSGNSTENGFENTANGFQALFSNTFGSFNTANGYQSLYFNTIGTFNTANGYSALFSNTNGIDNTADGNLALLVNTSGSFNTASGAGALKNLGSSGAGGTNNIALGSYAGSAFAGIESSNIDIGNLGVVGENNVIRIGTPGIHTQTYLAGVINGDGGGLTNLTLNNANDSLIAGGLGNSVTGSDSAISGGQNNTDNANQSSIGGGSGNVIQTGAYYSFLGSGGGNIIQANANTSFLGSGYHNLIQANAAGTVLIGGQANTILTNAIYAFLGGGYANTNTGAYSMIPGGEYNVAGTNSFAAGSYAQATNIGAFVWADNSSTSPFASTNNNSFNVRAAGGYRLYTTSSGIGGAGVYLAANGNSWISVSDRNAKKNFQPVNTGAVLDKLAAIPIQQWNYKWESDQDVPNIGPMAQDFKAAFYPGRDDKGISTLEFDGVELAAIQGLNQKLKEKSDEVDSLEKRVTELEQVVQSLTARK